MIKINFFVFMFIGIVFLFMLLVIIGLLIENKELEARNEQLLKDKFKFDQEKVSKKVIDRFSGKR